MYMFYFHRRRKKKKKRPVPEMNRLGRPEKTQWEKSLLES